MREIFVQNRTDIILTSGGQKAMKERQSGLKIVRVCFVEVGDSVLGDSVLGVFCHEFFQETLLDE